MANELMITEISEPRYKEDGNLRAFVDVTFNEVLTVYGYRVLEGENGYFVGAPSIMRKRDKKWMPVVRLTDTAFNKKFQDAVLKKYHENAKK